MKLNKRGDRRGVNGKSAVRGPNGRFLPPGETAQPERSTRRIVSVPVLPALPAPTEALPPATKKPRVARSTPTHEEIDVLAIEFDARCSPVFNKPLRAVPRAPPVRTPTPPLSQLSSPPLPEALELPGLPDPPAVQPAVGARVSKAAYAKPPPPVPPPPPPPPPEDKEEEEGEQRMSFDYATNAASVEGLRVLPSLAGGAKPRSQEMYNEWVRLQCGYDRRDTGQLAPHVTQINTPIPAMANFVKFFIFSAVDVASVAATDTATLVQISSIFKARNILLGTPAQLAESMQEFTAFPFYTLSAVRDGVVVGATVIRAHILSNGERLIQIELIASRNGVAPGVGTSLMRVIRAFSQVTSAHTGHVAAYTLKSKEATRFYERKLPEKGPHARALLYSVFLLDAYPSMPKTLEMRSVVVPPLI